MQGHLFPVEIVNEEPYSGTADLKLIGHDASGARYAIKTIQDHPLLPLTEWFCYNLCRLTGIATPEYEILTRMDGELAFGSKWDESTFQIEPTKMNHVAVAALLRDGTEQISRIMAVDAFLPNEDRHLGNFLFKNVAGRLQVLAFDWSRVQIMENRVFDKWPWQRTSNSAIILEQLKLAGFFDRVAAENQLGKIQQCPSDHIRRIIDAAPEPWRSAVDTSAIINWWETDMPHRVPQVLGTQFS